MAQTRKSTITTIDGKMFGHTEPKYGYTLDLEKKAEDALIHYFTQPDLLTREQGADEADVRLNIADGAPCIYVFIHSHKDSEAILLSALGITRWRHAETPDDMSERWKSDLTDSRFAPAVSKIVRDVFGDKYPHLKDSAPTVAERPDSRWVGLDISAAGEPHL